MHIALLISIDAVNKILQMILNKDTLILYIAVDWLSENSVTHHSLVTHKILIFMS